MCAGQGGVAESSPECAPAWKRLLCIWGVGSGQGGGAGAWPAHSSLHALPPLAIPPPACPGALPP